MARGNTSAHSYGGKTEKLHYDSEQPREQAYQVIIAISSILSISSLLCICLTAPSMYNYLDRMSTYSKRDFVYCETTARDVEKGVVPIDIQLINRTRREGSRSSNYGGYNPSLLQPNAPFFQECPACCIPGERGPLGDLGLPGLPGAPGPDGAQGRPGTTPNASCIPERVFEPPPCLPCPQGPRGPAGHPGFPGDLGDPGIPGRPGQDGLPGKQGSDGPSGPNGPPGLFGSPGDKGVTPDAHIMPGPPGESGETGPWGPPGQAGSPGENGFPGGTGEKGWPGPPGAPGPMGVQGASGSAGELGPVGTPGTCVCHDTEVVISDHPAPVAKKEKASAYPGAASPSSSMGYSSYGRKK